MNSAVELYEALASAPDEQTRARLIADAIAQVKADLLKWLVPLMFAQVAAIAALVKLL
jgi:hypothetical protein